MHLLLCTHMPLPTHEHKTIKIIKFILWELEHNISILKIVIVCHDRRNKVQDGSASFPCRLVTSRDRYQLRPYRIGAKDRHQHRRKVSIEVGIDQIWH